MRVNWHSIFHWLTAHWHYYGFEKPVESPIRSCTRGETVIRPGRQCCICEVWGSYEIYYGIGG